MATPKKLLPQKIDQTKIGYPQKNVTPQKNKKKLATPRMLAYFIARGLLLNFGKMAYFIAYGFINAIQTL